MIMNVRVRFERNLSGLHVEGNSLIFENLLS